jgi:hypothetical protein
MSKINLKLLRDFSKKMTLEDVFDDLYENYKITNVYDEEDDAHYYYELAEALFGDYENKRANYKAYVQPGMNARYMMELRKSAIIPMSDEDFDFYKKHDNLNTVEEIKAFRSEYLKVLCSDYADLEWQYYYMMRYYLGKRSDDLLISYEYCYDDCNRKRQTGLNDYRYAFIAAHMPGMKMAEF